MTSSDKSLPVMTIYMLMMLTMYSSMARLNKDLDRIYQWSMANRLINSLKSQAMIINPSLLPIEVPPQIRLGDDVIP
jgi:hypothetical protein